MGVEKKARQANKVQPQAAEKEANYPSVARQQVTGRFREHAFSPGTR